MTSISTFVLLVISACQRQEASKTSSPAESRPTVTVSGVNDQLISAAAMVALPPPGIAAADLPEARSAGAGNVAKFCSGCHNIPSPTAHSATDWPGVVRRMWLRIDLLPSNLGVAVPSVAERQSILQYLIDNSLKVSGSNLPEGKGRQTFAETCSRCHALPDPRQHSGPDWPAVVMRMEQRMDQMKVRRPTPEQTQEILLYLQKVSATPRAAGKKK
jgi:cytochrome c2